MMDVKGFLIDLDGVLYTGNKAIDGAQEAIDLLKEKKSGSGVCQTRRGRAGKRSPNGWPGSGLTSRSPHCSPLPLRRSPT